MITGVTVEEPAVPPVVTEARVVVSDPTELEMSPLRAGNCAAWSVPTTPVASGNPEKIVRRAGQHVFWRMFGNAGRSIFRKISGKR